MTQLNFDTKVLIEQVRCIEAKQNNGSDGKSDTSHDFTGHDFESRLQQRVSHLTEHPHWGFALAHAKGIWGKFKILAGIAALLLGAIATMVAISGDSTINIYWLLIVLIGFNFLSILLWLASITFKVTAPLSGLFAWLIGWVPNINRKRDTDATVHAADSAWLACQLGGAVGKWRFSQLSHGLWLVYLGTGLLALVLALSARQYDFVWGTTLLSGDAFVQLTAWLGQPLQALGFSTPDAEHVIATRIGSGEALGAEHRYHWAQFLIGALLLYGAVPRLVLLLASGVMLRVAQSRFNPDYYLPYYVRLRQILMPIHGDSHVVDADALGSSQNGSGTHSLPSQTNISTLPDFLLWVAVELPENAQWPLNHIASDLNVGHIVDAQSETEVLERMRQSSSKNVAVAVSPLRAPDRGLLRTILAITNAAAQTWLVLLEQPGREATASSRLEDWFRLAQQCDIPADRVVTIADR